MNTEETSSNFFPEYPVVYIVGETYQIVFRTARAALAQVKINGVCYTDRKNGVCASSSCLHRVIVPQKALNDAGKYEIFCHIIPDRQPYFPTPKETYSLSLSFVAPDRGGEMNLYMVADTHGYWEDAAKAALAAGEPDVLILCGDIGDSAQDEKEILTLFALSGAVTGGRHPVLYTRGNHDTRGAMAECLPDYMGTDRGTAYFSFRFGRVGGVLLDCGEDKPDDHPEYGITADFGTWREEEADFLEDIAARRLFDDSECLYRLGICHIPFTFENAYFVDFLHETYDRFIAACNALNLQALFSGHMHKTYICPPRSDKDGHPGPHFPTVVGARACDDAFNPDAENRSGFTGTRITLADGRITVRFTNSQGAVLKETVIKESGGFPSR